jgi:hypothetical protein
VGNRTCRIGYSVCNKGADEVRQTETEDVQCGQWAQCSNERARTQQHSARNFGQTMRGVSAAAVAVGKEMSITQTECVMCVYLWP